MSKPIDQAAISFLTEHAAFRSSVVFAALQQRFIATATNGNDFFDVPIREKLLSFEKSMLWVAFVHMLSPNFVEPLNTSTALTKIMSVYDIDTENLLTTHAIEDPESDEEDDDENADDESG